MADVLIVGGGIIGLLSAFELVKRGRQVTLVDAPARHAPASWAGGGILSPLFHWRRADALNRLALDGPRRYRALMRRLGDAGGLRDADLHESGLWVAASGDEAARARGWAAAWRQPCVAAPLGAHLPGGGEREGLWFPEVSNIRNPRLLKALRAWLRAHGVKWIKAHAMAVRPAARGGELCLEGGERLKAPAILVSAGAWSPALLKPLGIDVPLFPVKGEMLLYRLTPGRVPAIVLTESGYLIPRADGAVLVGSTLREGDDSSAITVAGRRALETTAAAILPLLAEQRPEHHWAGVRPGCARDWPYMGELPGTRGLFAAVGHYRNGLVAAPASAELMAQLICGEQPFLDPADYSFSGSLSPS